jgi:hypothetical protein
MATSQYTPSDRERFWSKVDRSGGMFTCWNWIAALDDKHYGAFMMPGNRKHRSHRVAWEMTHGPIPEGLCVLHNCPDGDNPRCCNPGHLWLGTQLQNIEDMKNKGRGRGKVMHGEANPAHKLTPALVEEIRQRYAEGGIGKRKLAREYGVGKSTVVRILRGETWNHAHD